MEGKLFYLIYLGFSCSFPVVHCIYSGFWSLY